jgi:hypothetical protein
MRTDVYIGYDTWLSLYLPMWLLVTVISWHVIKCQRVFDMWLFAVLPFRAGCAAICWLHLWLQIENSSQLNLGAGVCRPLSRQLPYLRGVSGEAAVKMDDDARTEQSFRWQVKTGKNMRYRPRINSGSHERLQTWRFLRIVVWRNSPELTAALYGKLGVSHVEPEVQWGPGGHV